MNIVLILVILLVTLLTFFALVGLVAHIGEILWRVIQMAVGPRRGS